jgi:DNA-binding HxlR family transcriptional regulator
LRDAGEQVDDGLVVLERVRREPGDGAADVVAGVETGEHMATATAAQRRRKARDEYDAFLAACPSRELLDRLSDKWVTLIVVSLADSEQRYSEIARTIAGVSQKMLTQTRRNLERDGIVIRSITPAVPVQVSYQLTPLGRSLLPVVRAIKDWSEDNMQVVQAARRRYDVRR